MFWDNYAKVGRYLKDGERTSQYNLKILKTFEVDFY